MPLYEYRCKHCGEQIEKLVRTDSDTPTSCPACKELSLEKILSTHAVKIGSTSAQSCDASAACPNGTCPFAK